jgi:hypothetical protein
MLPLCSSSTFLVIKQTSYEEKFSFNLFHKPNVIMPAKQMGQSGVFY